MHDETNSRRLGFLRCLVRVNDLPERCHPEQLAMLFRQFGPLRMWHVAMCSSGACKGYGCVIFHHCEHADEAIEVLNCYEFGERKLRVDWAYPCLNKLWKMPPLLEVPKFRFGTFKFSIKAYPRGECTPGSGQHRITSLAHGKFLRHVVRVSNMPPGFKVLYFQELFSPFGPMPMWDVPMFRNYICGCNPQIRMRFGVVVFKNGSDGERAINYLNGYEAGGCKLRVDWAYPSV
ncbi:hypothetical protein C2845_PM03G02900 [Panicum miliaceum]|uniref:RRM domain-containing protein n=1 Tax=Panicum miliaceum TaxID=4540 RepID=A0A3L6TFR7_PANMI|nr:hypothetical protein C2845_PM03G02900 [Panicum miliaceum]